MTQRVGAALLEAACFLTWLKQECGYKNPRPLDSGRWAAIWPLMFTHAIITGKIGNTTDVDDRWCYPDYPAAQAALDAWDGTGEPQGWTRHPATGRRRPEGDATKEYVAQ